MFGNKFINKIMKYTCLLFALLFATFALAGCKSRELKPDKQALQSVGRVGEYDVRYEEYYFLASLYKSEGQTDAELRELINENIITNYAILTLCDRLGIEIEQKELDRAVQERLDLMIDEEFGGKRKDYISALEKNGLTDSYVRFTLRTDLLYSKSEVALAESGELYTEEAKIIEYIKDNFIRTWHIMIADNKGDDSAKNLDKANGALADLRAGKTDMYELIGSAVNEDVQIPWGGYAFAMGSKDEAYEKAAFALEVGEYSDVVTFKSELANGEYVDCHYVIERLPLDDEYINEHYSDLYDAYKSAFIALKLEQIKDELEFVPNDYALSLDPQNLPMLDVGTDIGLIIIIIVCVLVVILLAVVTVILLAHAKKRKAALLAAKAERAKLKSNEK